jgi:hypothetical protein
MCDLETNMLYITACLRQLPIYSCPSLPVLASSLKTVANMPALSGFIDFDPDKDIHSLRDRVILVTGGLSRPGHIFSS